MYEAWCNVTYFISCIYYALDTRTTFSLPNEISRNFYFNGKRLVCFCNSLFIGLVSLVVGLAQYLLYISYRYRGHKLISDCNNKYRGWKTFPKPGKARELMTRRIHNSSALNRERKKNFFRHSNASALLLFTLFQKQKTQTEKSQSGKKCWFLSLEKKLRIAKYLMDANVQLYFVPYEGLKAELAIIYLGLILSDFWEIRGCVIRATVWRLTRGLALHSWHDEWTTITLVYVQIRAHRRWCPIKALPEECDRDRERRYSRDINDISARPMLHSWRIIPWRIMILRRNASRHSGR